MWEFLRHPTDGGLRFGQSVLGCVQVDTSGCQRLYESHQVIYSLLLSFHSDSYHCSKYAFHAILPTDEHISVNCWDPNMLASANHAGAVLCHRECCIPYLVISSIRCILSQAGEKFSSPPFSAKTWTLNSQLHRRRLWRPEPHVEAPGEKASRQTPQKGGERTCFTPVAGSTPPSLSRQLCARASILPSNDRKKPKD